MTIWELIDREGAATINLGFYGLFAVKVHTIPLEPEMPTTAWCYRVYGYGREFTDPWGRHNIHAGQELELL